MSDQLDRIEAEIKEIKALLNGAEGVIVRVDRVTQWMRARKWLEKTMVGAILVLVLNTFFKFFGS